MSCNKLIFFLFLILSPSFVYSNAKMGGDFSEDYFKKFEVYKSFKCNELNRDSVLNNKLFKKNFSGNIQWHLNLSQKVCDRNIIFLKDENNQDYVNLSAGVGDGIGNKYNKKENSTWNDFKYLERRRFEVSTDQFDFSKKSFVLEYDIRIPKKHKFIKENDSLGVGQLHAKENDAIWRFFLMDSGYWVAGVKAIDPKDYQKWNNIKIIINNYKNNYGLIIIVNDEIIHNAKTNNEYLMWAEYKKDTLFWKIGLYQQKLYENFYNTNEQSVDLKNVKAFAYDKHIEF